MLLKHYGGVTSVADCSYAPVQAANSFPETLIEVDGTRGTIRLGQGYRMTVATRSDSRTVDVAPPVLPRATRPWHNIQESVALIQQHWVDALRAGREPETSGADNLKTLAMVEAADRSASTGAPIDPSWL